MNTKASFATVLLLAASTGNTFAQAQIFDFENHACGTAYNPSSSVPGAYGWTAHKPGPLNGALCRTMTLTGTCTNDNNGNWGFPVGNQNPVNWNGSQLNKHYIMFQLPGAGGTEAFAFTRGVTAYSTTTKIHFRMAGKIQNQNDPPIALDVQLGTSAASGDLVNMYSTITWQNVHEFGQSVYAPYSVNTTSGSNVVWEHRIIDIPPGTGRVWIRFVTPMIHTGDNYRFYLDDVSLGDPSGMAVQGSQGTLVNEPVAKSLAHQGMAELSISTASPNPTTGAFTLYTTDLPANLPVEVFGANGRLVRSLFTTDNARLEFDLSSEPAGLYTVRIAVGEKSEVIRVVKE